MRFTLLAGTAILLCAAMPSAARADCLGDVEAARTAFNGAGATADPLRQSFELNYEIASRAAASSPATCEVVARQLTGLARLANIPTPEDEPVAAVLSALRGEAAAAANVSARITQAAAESGTDAGALQTATADYIAIISFRDAGLLPDGEDMTVDRQGWHDGAHAFMLHLQRVIDEAQTDLGRAIVEATKNPFSAEHIERIASARGELGHARALLQDAFRQLNKWTEGAVPETSKAPAKPPVKEAQPGKEKGPVITDLEGYLESICAPEAIMRQGKMVSGCTFWDRRSQTVPGPRKEQPYDAEQPAMVVDSAKLEIDYMAEPPRAGVIYYLKDHHIKEMEAGGVINTDPWGGLVIQLDLPRGQSDTARLSFQNGKAAITGLAGIDYSVRHPAEPMNFSFDRDPGNFISSVGQQGDSASAEADYETSSQTEARANDLAHQAVREELKSNYDKARAKLEEAARYRDDHPADKEANRMFTEARREVVRSENAYSEYLRKNAPDLYQDYLRAEPHPENSPFDLSGRSALDQPIGSAATAGSSPEQKALPEYDGPDGEGGGMPPEEQALVDKLESSRNAVREAQERMAAAEGDATAENEAKQIYDQANEAVARTLREYQDYISTTPRAYGTIKPVAEPQRSDSKRD
ncbi:hypothetical protein IC614_03965 [Allosphingosinicella flava]|uniref:Uncharacterized protein n=1 Tax=Allosphingosinicella flava TaxID=2771430 RepID=A0A7T2GKX0_9SPHN|nr:hypothetical protein [Sphingosinicella flava]QPQ55755.1 hypothetical protein IC614_03965 [Sphingosinicella flava]